MTESKRAIRSSLKRVDRHVIQPHEYAEAPELTDAQLARAVVSEGGRPVGRPRLAHPKEAVKLRLDAEVLVHFRRTGPGWQTRINDALLRVARAKTKKRA
jgi:uncharacterized protein (DUF4415 family)